MKGVSHDVEGLEFRIGDGDTCRIGLAILDGSDLFLLELTNENVAKPSEIGYY